jgi:hypothetical protein
MAAIFWLIGDHIGIRVWAELAFFLVIFTAGFSWMRQRWTRRSAMRAHRAALDVRAIHTGARGGGGAAGAGGERDAHGREEVQPDV